MGESETRARRPSAQREPSPAPVCRETPPPPLTTRLRALPVAITLIAVAIAGVLAWAAWQAYMVAPWTRDATVRAYVVGATPQVSGEIVSLPVKDDAFVRKGQVLAEIDPTDYRIALQQAEAALVQARATAQDAEVQAQRRESLSSVAVSVEQRQHYVAVAQADEAAAQEAEARVQQAEINLARTTIRSPVNGYVTNLTAQKGDYATSGTRLLSVVDSDSFWVDAYFEETNLNAIHTGDPARIKLMGFPQILQGTVAGISRGVAVANADAGAAGLAQVNPVFTWVQLAQRIPVRIRIDKVPAGVTLIEGETATVQLGS